MQQVARYDVNFEENLLEASYGKLVSFEDFDTLFLQNRELKKERDAFELLAQIRLVDLKDDIKEMDKLYDLLRCCLPFVRARCEETEYGDASARTTLELLEKAFKRVK